MNSEILNSKPPSDPSEMEQQIRPISANSGTEYVVTHKGFFSLFKRNEYYPAANAIQGDRYWQSKLNVKDDFWEAVFSSVARLDTIEIKWKFQPKKFQVHGSMGNENYEPLTEKFELFSAINKEGKVQSIDGVTKTSVVNFATPIFAKKIRINLFEPLKDNKFGIEKVSFFNKKTTMIITNQQCNECNPVCFFVNTDKPREGSKIRAYGCVNALSASSNSELFFYNNDNSISHYNSKLCVGINEENELALKTCSSYNNPYILETTGDTLKFKAYNDKCIYIDNSKKISENFVTTETEILVTTQSDDMTYKKENIKLTGENYWNSSPGQQKVTLQILFGKLKDSIKGQFENKRVDNIKIEWVNQPKKFMVYTWRPGFSWILRHVYNDYKFKTSNIPLIGEDISAIMLVLEEGYKTEENDNEVVYGINYIYIGNDSMKVKLVPCNEEKKENMMFDFETQGYNKIQNTSDYIKTKSAISITFEKVVNNYNKIKSNNKYLEKSKLKAQNLVERLKEIQKTISNDTIKRINEFGSNKINSITNPLYQKYVSDYKGDSSSVKPKSGERIGTKENPGIDCLSYKKMNPSILSGFFYIKPECSPKAIRVFCDFSLYLDAVDIYVFNDGIEEPNPDLSHLKIKDAISVRYQCAKYGMEPMIIRNSDTIQRIYKLLTALGYNLSLSVVVPLGYDYTCQSGNCKSYYNSFTDKDSPAISSFFETSKKKNDFLKPGSFAGLGYSDIPTMIKFEPADTKVVGLICSTNHNRTDEKDNKVKRITCDTSTFSAGGTSFPIGSNILVECPVSCNDTNVPVIGNSVYHTKSSICKAAIHLGLISTLGGKVYVRALNPAKEYNSSTSNGITSEEMKKQDGLNSFALLENKITCPVDKLREMIGGINDSTEDASFMELSSSYELNGIGDLIKSKKKSLNSLNPLSKDNKKDDKKKDNPDLFDTSSIANGFSGISSTISDGIKGVQKYVNDNKDNLVPKSVEQKVEEAKAEKEKLETEAKEKLEAATNTAKEIINKQVAKAATCENVTTDNAIDQVKKIRKIADWEYITQIQDKMKKVKEKLEDFNNNLSWSKEGSELSNETISKSISSIEKLKLKVNSLIKKVTVKALSRVENTKLMKEIMRNELLKQKSKDKMKLDYSKDPIEIFKKSFTINDVKSRIKSNWSIVKTNIKNRALAIGLTNNIHSPNNLSASMIQMNGKDFYDFSYTVDILVKSNGVCGVAFRIRDFLNYYALVIDKKAGYKSINKVVNGKSTVLSKIEDGGIILDNWYRVEVVTTASNIEVTMYDAETKENRKVIVVSDNTFSRGSVGVFANNVEGFYFDSMKVDPKTCWTPWIPKANGPNIVTALTNVYFEDFLGNSDSKYEYEEPSENQDGPAQWEFKRSTMRNGLKQLSTIYDASPARSPALAILKDKYMKNGILKVVFYPEQPNGQISILFRYNKQMNENGSVINIEYYKLSFIHSTRESENQIIVTKFSNGANKELLSINKPIKEFNNFLGYRLDAKHTVIIEVEGVVIKIKLSLDAKNFVDIAHITDTKPGIEYGRIAVGTFKTKALFTTIDLHPPTLYLSEKEKNTILTTEGDKIIFPTAALNERSEEKSNNKNNNGGNQSGKDGNGKEASGNSGGSGGNTNNGGIASFGKIIVAPRKINIENTLTDWTVCIKTSVEQQFGYCAKKHLVETKRKKCEDDFCDVCCEDNTATTHIKYECNKKCMKNKVTEHNDHDYSSCFNFDNKNNIYSYCEDELNDKAMKKICKLDMCNLCCSTMEVLKKKPFGMETIKNCLNDCSKHFNK